MENNYKPNSHLSKNKSKEGPVKKEKVEKIVKGAVKAKKKSTLLSMFLSDDVTDIKSYIINDVLIPTTKQAISDIVTNGIDMLFGLDTKKRNKSAASRVSYRSYYDRDDRDRDRDRSRTRTTGYNYDDVILETRGEAEDVLTRLDEIIDIYGMASVADLYDLVGISGQYTDNKYGWTDIRSATSTRVREGYLLKMPRAIPLN